jgi:hypothetical protein
MSVLPLPRTSTSDQEVFAEPAEPLIDIAMPLAPGVVAEHEALSSTRATVPPQPSRSTIDSTRVLAPAPRPMLVASPLDLRRPRHYPPRLWFLESSRMERELHRL